MRILELRVPLKEFKSFGKLTRRFRKKAPLLRKKQMGTENEGAENKLGNGVSLDASHLRTPTGRWNKIARVHVRKLHRNGMTARQISDLTHIPRSTVSLFTRNRKRKIREPVTMLEAAVRGGGGITLEGLIESVTNGNPNIGADLRTHLMETAISFIMGKL